jgi:hypothetical protein
MTQVAIMKDRLPGITRASFVRKENEVTVRNRTRATFLLALGVGALLLDCGFGARIVASQPRQVAPAAVVVPLVTVIICYATWLVAFRTTVRLRREGMVIENVFVRYSIPWRQGRQFYIHNGLRLRLIDGRTYGVWAFQGSLGATLIGYAAFEPIVEQLTAECDRIVTEQLPEYPPPPTSWHFQFPDWWVIFAVAVTSEAVVWITYFIAL